MKLRMLALFLAGLLAGGALAEDVVTLADGRTKTGKIVKEDEENLWLQVKDGPLLTLAKVRIAKIERGPEARKTDKNVPEAAQPEEVKTFVTGEKMVETIKELGSPDPAARKAAWAKIADKSAEAMPALLGMLNPKYKSDEYTRIGIVRALARLAPLSEQGSRTLAYDAVHDPYPEVRREICGVIRMLGDDTAVRELSKMAATEDLTLRYALAAVFREIDDPRLLAALVASIPSPSTTANVGNVQGLNEPAFNLPVGPGGAKVPIFLPSSSVQGTSSDVSRPAAELLKLIANKNLGSYATTWINWYHEKVGDISSQERSSESRSLREIMGLQ